MARTHDETVKHMLGLGWIDWSTGGGCMAWMREIGDGTYVLICTENNGLVAEDDDETWIVGRHNGDGDQSTEMEVTTLDDALAIWDAVQLAGDQRFYHEGFWGNATIPEIRIALQGPQPIL